MAVSPCCCFLFLVLIHGIMFQTCQANRKLTPLMVQPLDIHGKDSVLEAESTRLSVQTKVEIIGRKNGKLIPTRPPSPTVNGYKGMFAPPTPPPSALMLPTT
ncbi:hypothetical protein V6N13_148131 [Hibiscus sabdariffa]|uniref:Uncharacterized protein n=1 Tax=Hibiscus sabdariffa TaxID=183260 RepID=A0ABR2TY39_9ROSI